MSSNPNASSGPESSRSEVTRRGFLQAGSLALGGLALPAVYVRANEPGGNGGGYCVPCDPCNPCAPVPCVVDRSIPPVNPDIACIASTAGIYGKVSVIGLKEDGFDPLYRVKAKIFHTSPSPYDDPTDPLHPESDVTDGTRFPTIQTVEELDFNFQFVLEQVQPSVIDKRVPDAKHETGTEDSDNWLVIWYDFGDAETPRWVTPSVIRLNCRLIPFTDAEGNWYDSFQYGTNNTSLTSNTSGELTPGGYYGSNYWKIYDQSGAKTAVADVPADNQAILTFDPGLPTFHATHTIHIPGNPGSGWNQMWALRSVRHIDETHRWQWQIGYTSDDYYFHELIEWNGEDSFWRAAEEIAFTPNTTYPCAFDVDEDDFITAVFDATEGGGTLNAALSYQSDEFKGETAQALNAYYDGAKPSSAAELTGFDDLAVKRSASFPLGNYAPLLATATTAAANARRVRPRDPRPQALVLCKLQKVHLSKKKNREAYWRPSQFLQKVGATPAPVKWRWTDVGKVLGGGKIGNHVSLYLLHGDDMEDALKKINGTDCVVVWHEVAGSEFAKTESLDDAAKIKNLLALGGYQQEIFEDGCRRDKVGTAVINEVRKKNVNRRLQKWSKDHQGTKGKLANRVTALTNAHASATTPTAKGRIRKSIVNLHKHTAILESQYAKAQAALVKIDSLSPEKVKKNWTGRLTIHGSHFGEAGSVQMYVAPFWYHLGNIKSWSLDQIELDVVNSFFTSTPGTKSIKVVDNFGNSNQTVWTVEP
ncbi:MAG: hypothetical protein WD069_15395 [Planctomycetales bacterium]